ncbi:phenoloxidase-activating factor 3-like [Amphibalanus amphitrite]|uniref:phenoloxidase-activating factor 3-like n=1 Tax=Amphibalanus amphitrite TaxID=1232801 RepID=UPI001C917148|nr:phenoloxidase-activating factor 3-like [Amphibalanus amphitrite]
MTLTMRLAAVLLVCWTVASHAEAREKRQAIQFGVEPRPFDSDCVDYARRPGRCGPLRDCPGWLRVVSNHPSQQDVHNLRNSLCGRTPNQVPLICCPRSAGPIKETIQPPTAPPTRPTPRPTPRPTQPPPTRPPTPRPTQPTGGDRVPEEHPNRRLLPNDNACGINIHNRIVGGNVADLAEYPWLAILGYEVVGTGSVEFNCGGTLINNRYVLTASHCVVSLPSDFRLTSVRLGEYNLRTAVDCQVQGGREVCADPVQDFGIAQVIAHPDYNKPNRFWNDIALLRLDRQVQNSLYVSPLCLPFGDWRTRDLGNTNLWVAGFGLTQAFGDSSDLLMELKVPVVSNDQCAQVFRRQQAVIGPNQMCAGGEAGRDSCSGDSGGPLMGVNQFGPPYRIVGVVSFGVTRCGTANVPGVYTRVGQYLNWIMDNIRA